ncbi:histidine kinase [Aliihoeflea aestuarii]|uniref:histidine kinase n=1 Tax=Aliihoeflea aestuarii TaxID=453840 RepID=UPI002094010C|nr:histidine kinase [Aliihoeflea aestuarii]MCO6390649.1 histidine kinase [Aliihoeflea aestuarii]
MAQVNGTYSRLIDEEILDRQTMGDHRLAAELLAMFVAQLDAASLEMATCPSERRAALGHALKGTARSLGIEEVAACAADLEVSPTPDGAATRLGALAVALRREVDARQSRSG